MKSPLPGSLAIAVAGLTIAYIPVASAQTLELDTQQYLIDQNITATWSGGPGNATDWVGIYRPGDVPGNVSSTRWLYTNGSQSASGSFPNGSVTFANPGLDPGNYLAYFFSNDGYSVLAGPVNFSVASGPPVNPPAFVTDPFRKIHAIVGEAYSETIGAYARDPDYGDPLTFSKLSGPAWLSIAAGGSLSGTPAAADVGTNVFVVKVEDAAGMSDTATMQLEVFAPGTVHLPQLKLLSFNIWVGTNNVADGYNKGIESILLSDADIVAVSENNGRAAQWANELGWHVFQSGSDDAVLSRYPIVHNFTASAAVGAQVQISASPLREIVFWSCHLTAYPYGPYDARDAVGSDDAKVAAALQSETASGRLAQINNILSTANSQLVAADSTPVFLLGDFNTPSHLDWTPQTVAAGMHFGLEVDWPVTLATENAGMVDAYRVVHPHPVLMPGNTWTPIFPDDVQDRIDMVHFKGAPVSVVWCEVFTTIDRGRWPSDHAGVLGTFHIDPVDADADGLADAWEVRQFGNTASQDAGGNLDRDQHSHLAEYAFGLDPLNGGDAPAVSFELDSEGDLLISYRRLAGGTSHGNEYFAGGVRYSIELSTDLESWLPADTETSQSASPRAIGDGIEKSTYHLSPTAASSTRHFARIRVTN